MDNPVPRHRSFIFPVLLLVVGFYLLAYNLEWIDWSPWRALMTLWPLFIVAAGLDLLLRRTATWISLSAALLFAALLILLLNAGGIKRHAWTRAEGTRVQRVDVPLGQAASAHIEMRLDAGDIQLAAAAPGGTRLVEGEARLPQGARLVVDQNTTGSEEKVRIESELKDRHESHVHLIGDREWDHRWTLGLARTVPIAVDIRVNAGTFDLDFSELNIPSLKAEIQAGSGGLRLSKGVAEGSADLSVQVGTLEITVPGECAARVRTDGGLNALRGDRDRYTKTADGYETRGDGKGTCRWEITVHGGLSSLTLR